MAQDPAGVLEGVRLPRCRMAQDPAGVLEGVGLERRPRREAPGRPEALGPRAGNQDPEALAHARLEVDVGVEKGGEPAPLDVGVADDVPWLRVPQFLPPVVLGRPPPPQPPALRSWRHPGRPTPAAPYTERWRSCTPPGRVPPPPRRRPRRLPRAPGKRTGRGPRTPRTTAAPAGARSTASGRTAAQRGAPPRRPPKASAPAPARPPRRPRCAPPSPRGRPCPPP